MNNPCIFILFSLSTDAKDEPKPQPVQQKQDKLNHPPGTNIHHPIEDVNCSKDSPNDVSKIDFRYFHHEIISESIPSKNIPSF